MSMQAKVKTATGSATGTPNRQRIAIVGSGIAGLTCAYLLHRHHDIQIFEAADYAGGHTHTLDVTLAGKSYPVNTGFIVFNDWTYPNFIKLMQQLGVESEASSMSFSVHCETSRLEYNGTSLNSLFAQRTNLLRPNFWRMVRDIIRFNRQASSDYLANAIEPSMTLGRYLQDQSYSDAFRDHYLVPMVAAIWSCDAQTALDFPFEFFVRFFSNHGMLSVDERPQWRVLKGGSRTYVERMLELFGECVHYNCQVRSIQRNQDGVVVESARGSEQFDQVILACHSNQALSLLRDPSAEEREILGAIRYQDNEVVLHTDTRLLPDRKLAWAAWNYRIPRQTTGGVALTYNINILQNFDAPETFCVTLNQTDRIDPTRIIRRFNYAHPVYSLAAVRAQQRFTEISGTQNRTHYCGAYWLNGFHEDGVNSALRVCSSFGASL